MPSRFEPCGLNQLYSLKYGTVPVVRETGGLADTITGYGSAASGGRPANGFSFQEYSPLALSETLRRACDLYPSAARRLAAVDRHRHAAGLVLGSSARQYVELYRRRFGVLAGRGSPIENWPALAFSARLEST